MSILMHSFNSVYIPQINKDTIIAGYLIPKDFVNATQMCKASGKKLNKYFEYSKTKPFLDELEHVHPLKVNGGLGHVIAIQGAAYGDMQGTWVSFQVAMNLAQWISPEFAAWASITLVLIVKGDYQALTAEAEQAQAKLQQQWDVIREAGKVTRLKLTDAIQAWYERNPNGTTRPAHAMYAQTTDNIYKALWQMNAKQLEEFFGCDRHEVRNVIDSESLAILERAEDRVIEFIEDDNIKPVDAVTVANIRAKKDLPKSKLW